MPLIGALLTFVFSPPGGFPAPAAGNAGLGNAVLPPVGAVLRVGDLSLLLGAVTLTGFLVASTFVFALIGCKAGATVGLKTPLMPILLVLGGAATADCMAGAELEVPIGGLRISPGAGLWMPVYTLFGFGRVSASDSVSELVAPSCVDVDRLGGMSGTRIAVCFFGAGFGLDMDEPDRRAFGLETVGITTTAGDPARGSDTLAVAGLTDIEAS